MINIALAGQPNCGKSTIFNMLSGINQHVANYPGVTVDKKSAKINYQQHRIEIVDLPGTYSFSPFSLEEQVAKDYLLDNCPDVIVNVVDASCLQRSLALTFQLIELGLPMIIVLNMMDIAEKKGIAIDAEAMAAELGVPVITSIAARKIGKAALLDAVVSMYNYPRYSSLQLNYSLLEPIVADTIQHHAEVKSVISPRWLALKLLEGDERCAEKLGFTVNDYHASQAQLKVQYPDLDRMAFIASVRHNAVAKLVSLVVKREKVVTTTLSHRIDQIVLNRWLSFPLLALVIFSVYELSIVGGYQVTQYVWPYWAMIKNYLISLLPEPEFTYVPMITAFGVWMINSMLALLNYIPIFFILFALIAIMEDVGYMPRIAFMLDRLFRRYGLHGQSTLPLVLGGAFVGGCAVPGIMASKGIADERARLATIMTVPYMNCMAKVPFYTLLLGAFFTTHMSLMMFFISTITLFIALCFAKCFSFTLLKHRQVAPFIMELPSYHLPLLKGVLLTACQRVWVYISKVSTIVVAVAAVLFVLLQFPGLTDEQKQYVHHESQQALHKFQQAIASSPYAQELANQQSVFALLNIYNRYRADKMSASSSEKVDGDYQIKYPNQFQFLFPKDKEARLVNRALRDLARDGQRIEKIRKDDKITRSFLGMFGSVLEPVTQWAGFDWRVNVAFLSSFAARESAVATLGAIYESGKTERVEATLGSEEGYTPLHAVAMIIFMIFTPPCIATMIVLKMNVNSYRLMLTAMLLPFGIGILVASLFFQIGQYFQLSGLLVMALFYLSIVVFWGVLGCMPMNKKRGEVQVIEPIYVRHHE